MQALSSLPAWRGKLILDQATFPIQPPTEYKILAYRVYASYHEWELGGDIDTDSDLMKALAAGVNKLRKRLRLGELTVWSPNFYPSKRDGEEMWIGNHFKIVSDNEMSDRYDTDEDSVGWMEEQAMLHWYGEQGDPTYGLGDYEDYYDYY